MAQNVGAVRAGGAQEHQDRGHTHSHTQAGQTQTAHSNPNQKTGLLDEIKQKIPGGQTQAQASHSTSSQKPGLVDKIKAKIPGGQSK